MIVAMEMAPKKLWWDLFCSWECCKATHPAAGHEDAEAYPDLNYFSEQHFGGHDLDKDCFNCGISLRNK